MEILDKIREKYDLKWVGAPEYYLGSDYISSQNLKDISSEDVKGIAYAGHSKKDKCLDPIWIKHGITTAFSVRTYISNTVDRLETMVGQQFGRYDTPMSEALHPEIDDTPFLDPIKHSQYRSLVGCANWLATLGRFDIAYATNTFSRFGMQPREGHMKGIIRVLDI